MPLAVADDVCVASRRLPVPVPGAPRQGHDVVEDSPGVTCNTGCDLTINQYKNDRVNASQVYLPLKLQEGDWI